MSDANKDVVRRFTNGLTKFFEDGDTAFLDLLDPAGTVAIPGMPPNVEGLKQALPMFRVP